MIFTIPFNVVVPSTFTTPLKSESPFTVKSVPAVSTPPPITAVASEVAPVLNEPELNALVTVAEDNVVAPVTPSVPTSVVFPPTLRFASRSVFRITFKSP